MENLEVRSYFYFFSVQVKQMVVLHKWLVQQYLPVFCQWMVQNCLPALNVIFAQLRKF